VLPNIQVLGVNNFINAISFYLSDLKGYIKL